MDKKANQSLNPDPVVEMQVRKFIERAQGKGIVIERAILFGSQVKGGAKKGSDIDLCVISPHFGKDYHQEEVELLRIAQQFAKPMDVIPYNPTDLNDKYDPLAKEIRTHGIQIT